MSNVIKSILEALKSLGPHLVTAVQSWRLKKAKDREQLAKQERDTAKRNEEAVNQARLKESKVHEAMVKAIEENREHEAMINEKSTEERRTGRFNDTDRLRDLD